MNKSSLHLVYLSISILMLACGDDEHLEEPITEGSIEFTVSDNGKGYKSISDPDALYPTLSIPISQDQNSKITDYVKVNYFKLGEDSNESINIQFHHVLDIIDGSPDLDELFLNDVNQNEVNYIIDQIKHTGFGVAIEYKDDNDVEWKSYNDLTSSMDINQNSSTFEIIETIEVEDGYFIMATFNCRLFNDSGEELGIQSGNVVFYLR